MAIARHGSGPGAVASAVGSQVHPVFMLPPLAASAFGAVLSRSFDLPLAALHLAVVFCALYTAHVKDGYVDFHARGEDEDHPLTAGGCRLLLTCSTAGFFLGAAALAALVDPVAALLALPGWLVGYFHAPQLDTNPVTATVGYPLGIAFALLGGHYVQTTVLPLPVLAFAGVFLVILSGIKVIDDAKDFDYDRSIDKRTVAVLLGREQARRVAFGLMAAGLLAVLVLAALGVFPPSAVGSVVVFGAVAVVARRADDALGTKLLVRGSYLFLAVLVAAVWFTPLDPGFDVRTAGTLSGLLPTTAGGLPDIGVFGPYTYLVTELLWGTVALALLAYSGAWRAAARTVAVLYPFAYLWDWYTLTVGVFAIPLRTGVEFAGIPIEEHLFMLLVPAMVVATHESLRKLTGEPASGPEDSGAGPAVDSDD